jgi:hypothetical protein
MTTRVSKLTIFLLVLAALAAPAFAGIQYSYCNSGCSDNTGTGTYAAWQTAAGSAGLIFSTSPATFFAGGLDGNGIFTDASETLFAGYSNATNPNGLTIAGNALAQTVTGTGSGIQITLPSNTYAIAFILSTVSGFGSPYIELNDRNLANSNYSVVISNSSTSEFFGILSDAPIASLFIGNIENFSGKVQINSFELGQLGGGDSGGSETPELSSLSLIGTGLVLVGFLRRRGRIQKPNGSLA